MSKNCLPNGIDVSYETIDVGSVFGPVIAQRLRAMRPAAYDCILMRRSSP